MQTHQAPWPDLSAKALFEHSPLYLITDGGALRNSKALISTLEQTLRTSGEYIAAIQLREQSNPQTAASNDELRLLGIKMMELCKFHGVKLVINRNVDVAEQIGADGIHLGNNEMPSLAKFRTKFDLVGYSAHSTQEAKSAQEHGASFVTLSPIFPPLSKQDERPPLGVETLSIVKSTLEIPVIALGGISKENAATCRLAGADGIAAIGSILGSSNPSLSARELYEAWQ